MRYADHWPQLAKWWDAMQILPSRLAEVERARDYAVDHQDIYEQIGNATNVPWAMLACLHWRESGGNFNTYLGNGQLLTQRTTIVPIGRGPFTGRLPDLNAFVTGGIDAVKQEGWGAIIDWRLEKQLFYMEAYNGPGYYMRSLPSPYLWGATSVQQPGKYTGDGRFDPSAVDSQIGCAPMLQLIAQTANLQLVRESA